MCRARVLAIVLLTACLPLSRAQEREWTYASGDKFKAKLVRELDGEAIFVKDGRFLSVPLNDLAEEDRKLVLAAGNGKSETNAGVNEGGTSPALKLRHDTDPGGKVAPLVKPKTPVVSRDWTDTSGNRTYGKFVRIHERNVIVLRGARTIAMPFDELSLADQNYVNQVLADRGEQPLDTPSAERPAPAQADTGSSQAGASAPGEPAQAAEEPGVQGNARGSQFFDELRQRQEDRRREQEEFAAQSKPPETRSEGDAAPSESPAIVFTEPPLAPTDGPGQSEPSFGTRRSSGALRIDGKTVAEMRPVLIMAGVLLGLFAVLGVIVFIATTIASGNTPRHQRRLY